MSKQNRYLCGTPKEFCTGGRLDTDQSLSTDKCHSQPVTAFKCHVHYLVKHLGYRRVGMREFQLGDGPILVLNKQSRYGAKLQQGKAERFIPERKRQGLRGTII